MRRKDREVTGTEEIRQILDRFKVCRIGLVDAGKPYIIPVNMAYEFIEDRLIIYFHCAKEGKKIDLIRKNATVGFEMDQEIGLTEGNTPCQYSYRYVSIIGSGTASFVEDEKEKAAALTKIMKHQTGKDFTEFDENPNLLSAVCIIRVDAEEYACKKNL
ncbi:MAG: pyridoxamine 5'-phosphate oxidase family protein [Lachnospiraceae bacterium]